MRKKIPTITRPDPAYAAALRQEGNSIPRREEDELAGPVAASVELIEVAIPAGEPGIEPLVPALDQESATDAAGPRHQLRTSAHAQHPTRKIDIRVNALARHESALQACGVDPAHVVRAALRRAVKGWCLAPVFAPPSNEQRTKTTQWQARTSLAVDATNLEALLRDHDPLDVLSKWALIRGQVEPHVWAEIDALLTEITDRAAVPHDPVAPQDT